MKTNTQHTPGPWNVGDDSPNDYEGPIIDTRDRAVAVITIDHETESTPEDRANARLIAAAPELLDAAELVDAANSAMWSSATVDCNAPQNLKNQFAQAMLLLQDAITKATGKE